jgi:hypothetical protein
MAVTGSWVFDDSNSFRTEGFVQGCRTCPARARVVGRSGMLRDRVGRTKIEAYGIIVRLGLPKELLGRWPPRLARHASLGVDEPSRICSLKCRQVLVQPSQDGLELLRRRGQQDATFDTVTSTPNFAAYSRSGLTLHLSSTSRSAMEATLRRTVVSARLAESNPSASTSFLCVKNVLISATVASRVHAVRSSTERTTEAMRGRDRKQGAVSTSSAWPQPAGRQRAAGIARIFCKALGRRSVHLRRAAPRVEAMRVSRSDYWSGGAPARAIAWIPLARQS